MGDHRSDNAAADLRDDIEQRFSPTQIALQREDGRDGRVEMRAGDRPQSGDQDHENRSGRKRVGEQCQRDILRQALRHDA